MNVHIKNQCKHSILFSLENEEQILLKPFETLDIDIKKSDKNRITITRDCESYISKMKYKVKMYNLVIKSEYIFTDICNGEIFYITRERVRLDIKTFYDRLFLSSTNATCISEINKIVGEENIKKKYNNAWYIDMFLINPLVNTSGLFILMLITGAVLTLLFGWKLAIIYFPISYLILIGVNQLIDKIFSVIGKKVLKIDPPRREFFNYFQSEFINNYYLNNNRTPFFNDVETD